MFCHNCGSPVSEGSKFCPECGAPLGHVSQDVVSNIPPSVNGVPQPRRRWGKPAIAAVICLVALLCVAAGVLLFVVLPPRGLGNAGRGSNAGEQSTGNAERQETQNKAHEMYPVDVSLDIPDFDETTSTPIPMLVTNTGSEDKDEKQYVAVTPSSATIDLESGTYSIQVVGSPIAGDGQLYTCDAEPAMVEVGSDSSASVEFELVPVVPENVTDQQIQDANDALLRAGVLDSDVATHCDKARALRQKRIDEIEAERKAAEEAEAAAEQARRQNPSSVDGASSPATLKGTLVREEWPTDKTQMAWSAVGYFLEFDSPVTVTYTIGGGTQTSTVTRLQVASVEQYADNADVDLDAQSDPYWEQHLGDYIAVSGKLMNTGNAHCLAEALFVDPVFVEAL